MEHQDQCADATLIFSSSQVEVLQQLRDYQCSKQYFIGQ